MDYNMFLIKFFGSICCGAGLISTVIIMLILSLRRKNDMKP